MTPLNRAATALHESLTTADALITAGMLADCLRPIVLGGENSCLKGTPMIPLHRATVSAIYQHLERLANIDGEQTDGDRVFAAYSNPTNTPTGAAEC